MNKNTYLYPNGDLILSIVNDVFYNFFIKNNQAKFIKKILNSKFKILQHQATKL